MKKLLSIVLLACTLLPWTHVKAISAPISSFETPADMSQVTARSVVFSQTPTSVTDGRSALKVVFQPAAWSDLILKMSKPLDFSNTAGLTFDVSNPGENGLPLGVEMVDANGKACAVHVLVTAGMTSTFHILVGGGAEATSVMPYGMQTLPSSSQKVTSVIIPGNTNLDMTHIVSIWFYKWQVSTPQTLIFDNLNFVPQNPSLGQVVDRFGQYSGSSWDGKLTSEYELTSRRILEENTFSATTTNPDRDEYGGWKSGPSLTPNGFFRTVKTNGKWSLVTPTGHLFFSLGLDGIDYNAPTAVTGREYMFSWLPNSTDSLADAYGTANTSASSSISQSTTFDFYKANLERKYGSNYLSSFVSTALNRIQSWGFNTIGNSSTSRLYRGHVPYAFRINISGTYNHIYSGSDHWGPMHDPFDPRFAVAVAQCVQAAVPQAKNDPWLLGYFVDNELSWAGGGTFGRYGLVYGTLQQDAASSPAKQALISDLRTSYGTIAKLNIAWATQFKSWDELGRPYTAPATPPRLMPVDMSRFMLRYARQYFSIVRTELKKQDASHLYLGCRFGNYYTPEVLQAASENCDVMSFNIYEMQVSPDKWNFLAAYNKPCIIGEFQSGSRDSGMFSPGLVAVPNNPARGDMFQNYVRSVLDNPVFVGCHWFRYVDEPLMGRAQDGENGNFGFVDVTDTPYQDLISAARSVSSDLYSERYGQSN